MARTRNQLKAAKKITFDEDEDSFENNDIIEVPDDGNDKQEGKNVSESDSESDSDEAPEEESTSKAKQDLLLRDAQRKEAEAEKRRIEREKRKQQDLYNKQQQEEKKLRQEQRQREEKHLELPELLPEDILNAVSEPTVTQESKPVSKHIRLDDIELTKDIKKQMKLEKLKQLKASNKATVKKGPVRVQVLSNSKLDRVPPKTDKIFNSRDKWLKRKSLNKK